MNRSSDDETRWPLTSAMSGQVVVTAGCERAVTSGRQVTTAITASRAAADVQQSGDGTASSVLDDATAAIVLPA